MRSRTKIPKYRLHKSTGRGVVRLGGKDIYLGEHNSTVSLERYDRLIGEWLASGRSEPERVLNVEFSINELIAAYWAHVESYYCDGVGRPTSEVDNIRQALRPLRKLYGSTSAEQFGPRCLEAVRSRMIGCGWCRTHINRQVHRLRSMFRWATSKELIPGHVLAALRSLGALKKGRCSARESSPIKPVSEADITAIRSFVSAEVWALSQLMMFTGARAGELVRLQLKHLACSEAVWSARLSEHKSAHHGRIRSIYFGPKAQRCLRGFLAGCGMEDFLFSPRRAEAARHLYASSHRRANQEPNPKKSNRVLGDHYSVASFRRAIHRACDKAGIQRWSPHQLRHTAATRIRAEFGVEHARAVLGHSSVSTTEIYAEVDQRGAERVMAEIG